MNTWPERWVGRLLDFVCLPLVLAKTTSSKPLRVFAFICFWPWAACTMWCILVALPLLICQLFIEVVEGI